MPRPIHRRRRIGAKSHPTYQRGLIWDIPITREEALVLRELLAGKIQSLNLEDHPVTTPNYIRLFNKLGKAL